jgi:hypothetical protein
MATYYVDGAVGNDANAGTSEGAGNAWATIQKALDNVSSSDKVWVKSSATYNEALTTSTAGLAAGPIVFEGYDSSTGDEGVAVNDGTIGSLVNGWTPIAGTNYYVWKNFQFTNFSGTAFGSAAGDWVVAYRIRASNSGSGISLDQNNEVLACHADNNSGDGFFIGAFGTLVTCISQNNSGVGFEATGGMAVVNCLAYENSGNGINWIGANAYGLFVNNTIVAFSGSGQSGLYLNPSSSSNKWLCINNTVSGYSGVGGFGIETSAIMERALIFNNNVFDCAFNYQGGSDQGGGTTSDPSFVDAGSDDYTPDSGSPLIAAGLDLSDVPGAPTLTTQTATVGAILRATVSAGGGLLMPNKRGGKQ